MDIKQKTTAITTVRLNIQTYKRLQKELREQADGLDSVIEYAEKSLEVLEKENDT